MSRRIHLLNLFGVLTLALLCAFQWRGNRNLNLETNRLEHTRQAQAAVLSEQSKTLSGQSADLDRFRAQLEHTLAEWADAKSLNTALDRRAAQLTEENTALKISIAEWATAVQARDERLSEANRQITTLASRVDETVGRFNRLAINYNEAVRQLNETRAQAAASAPSSPPP